MSFETLHLDPALTQAIQDQGYENPTPIQSQAIPLVLSGQDLLAGAQTGTGKTAAFTLPMLHRLHTQAPAQKGVIRALVLTPTRELAAQVEDSVRVYGKHLKLRSTAIFGGVGMNPQVKRLQAGVDVLVATPGRLLDLADQGLVNLSGVEMLVLDEADRMLDMGFIHDVKKVLKLLPDSKQSLLFSATFSDEIRTLAATLLKNPASVQVTPPNTTAQRIDQTIYPVGRARKKDLLLLARWFSIFSCRAGRAAAVLTSRPAPRPRPPQSTCLPMAMGWAVSSGAGPNSGSIFTSKRSCTNRSTSCIKPSSSRQTKLTA